MTIEPSRLRTAAAAQAEALPYDRYEALLELYQAENAVQIARSIGADRYAPESMHKADALLANARDMHARKQDPHMIVSSAREAAQIAEDARVISLKRRDDDRPRPAQPSQDESRIRQEQDQTEPDVPALEQHTTILPLAVQKEKPGIVPGCVACRAP